MIALAVLTACFFLILPLFQYALQYSSRVEKSAMAIQVAQSRLTQVRAWARQKATPGYNFNQLASYPTGPAPDPEHPEFEVRVAILATTLYSPTSTFESLHPPAERRALQVSVKKVVVHVKWTTGGIPDELTLASLLAEPTRRLRAADPVQVSGVIPGPLPKDSPLTFSARAFDSEDREIPDLMISWSIYMLDGNGRFQALARDGKTATFQNRSRTRSQDPYYTGGRCRVRAHVRYRGEDAWGDSDSITLLQ